MKEWQTSLSKAKDLFKLLDEESQGDSGLHLQHWERCVKTHKLGRQDQDALQRWAVKGMREQKRWAL